MNLFLIFAFIMMTTLMCVTTISSNNVFAQTSVKEIVIGPDSSKDGDDVYNPTEIIVNIGDSDLD